MNNLLSTFLFSFIVLVTSCNNEKEPEQVDKEINHIDTLSSEQVNALRLKESSYSYQIDSLLERADIFEINMSEFEIIDVVMVKNDTLNPNQLGITFHEDPLFAYEVVVPIIYELKGNERDIKGVLDDRSVKISFKINSFQKMTNIVGVGSGIDQGYSFGYFDIDSKDAPFYVKGEILRVGR